MDFSGKNIIQTFPLHQAVNVDKLCGNIPQVAANCCPDLEEEARGVANKFGRVLLYSKCHNLFNSSQHFTDMDLSCLRKYMYIMHG